MASLRDAQDPGGRRFCSRKLTAGACPYANICEQCDTYVPDPAPSEVLTGQLDDIRAVALDAEQHGWGTEAARHHHVEAALEQHLTNVAPQHLPEPVPMAVNAHEVHSVSLPGGPDRAEVHS